MIKPIYGLCIVLSLTILSIVPTQWNDNPLFSYSTTTEEGSHPTVSSTSSSEEMMVMIDCPTSVIPVYLDETGTVVISIDTIAGVSGGTAPFVFRTEPQDDSGVLSFFCNEIPSNPRDFLLIVEDALGALDTCAISFIVSDSIQPTIDCPSDLVLVADLVSCEVNVRLFETDLLPDDNCSVYTIANDYSTTTNDINDDFPVGSTDITYIITDVGGNTDSCTINISVTELIAPILVCPGADTISVFYAAIDTCGNTTNLADVIFTDNCLVDTLFNDFADSNLVSTFFFPANDTTTVEFIGEDYSGNRDTCTFRVAVIDNILPTITCPMSQSISADKDSCEAYVSIAKSVANDNCDVVTITNSYSISNSLSDIFPVGDTTIWVYATDGVGNVDSCSFTIEVEDDTAPEILSRGDKVVSLSTDSNTIHKDSFFMKKFPFDACCIASYGVSRADGGCGSGVLPADEVNFCCADVGTTVVVTLTAEDCNGNVNTLTSNVMVMDNTGPSILNRLPDVTVSCNYFIDISDLSPFGTFVFDPADRDSYTIETNPTFFDGLAEDNCSVLTTMDMIADGRVNGAGVITRTIIIKDTADREVQDIQNITVIDTSILTIADIQFPADTTLIGNCSTAYDPSVTGSPIINDTDICTMPGVDVEDQIFNNPNSGCISIKRTWTVIDMAQFVPNTNLGRWTDVQYITIINNEAPTFDKPSCDSQEFSARLGACDVLVEMTASATDDCTQKKDLYYRYQVDYNRDGTIDAEGENDSLKITMPAGEHWVTWKVEDRCGNLAKCVVEITAREEKAPIPVCLSGLSMDLNEVGVAELWAKDINRHSYDNCTANADLQYSFSTDINDKSRTFICDDKGVNPLKMYVTDLEGNQSFCISNILITDNIDTCKTTGPTVGSFRVGGLIATEENITISETNLSISDGIESKITKTDVKGKYLFADILGNEDYSLAAHKNDNCLEGVSTLDLVLIQRHILGQGPLTSPYKLLAADINGSESITASDLVQLRKLILGVDSDIADQDCWLFIDKAFTFDDPQYPWNYPVNQEIEKMDIDMMSSDFVAVKIGDVNGSVSNINNKTSENRSTKMIQLTTADKVFEEGEEVLIPVKINSDVDLLAMQINFAYDTDMLVFNEVMSDVISIQPSYYSNKKDGRIGNVSLAYSNNAPTKIVGGEHIITLRFTAIESDKLSSVLTENSSQLQAVIYDQSEEINYIQFDFDVESLLPIEVSNPSPNPFINSTQIGVKVAYEMPLEIKIFDQSGIVIYKDYSSYSPGLHYVKITENMLNAQSGVFFVHVSGAETQEIKKLIRIN